MLTAVHDTIMYWTSRVDGELTSVILRFVGQAPTRVTLSIPTNDRKLKQISKTIIEYHTFKCNEVYSRTSIT